MEMTILHFYTCAFQTSIFFAKLWLTSVKKICGSEIIQHLFKERTKFLGQSSSFLEAFELCENFG